MKANLWGLLVFSFFAIKVYSLDHFALSSEDVKSYINQFSEKSLNQDIEHRLISLLDKQRQHYIATQSKKRSFSILGSILNNLTNTHITSTVVLDGFVLRNIPAFDLEIVNRLTLRREAGYDFFKTNYPVHKQVQGEKIILIRECQDYLCKAFNDKFPFSLEKFEDGQGCSDAICAVEKIFGTKKGKMILWAYLNYGIHLSPFGLGNTEPEGFDEETLEAIILAVKLIPEQLHSDILSHFGFHRFIKGSTLKIYVRDGKSNTIANAFGYVFDPINDLNFYEKVYVFVHELGHRVSNYKHGGFDTSEDWKKAVQTEQPVSVYGKTNLSEDFAEAFTLYRFNSQKLKLISPLRYQFLKEKIFSNKEF